MSELEKYLEEIFAPQPVKLAHITAETMAEITGMKLGICKKILKEKGKSLDNVGLWYEFDMSCK